MSWLVAHKESERLADLAHDAKRQDQYEKSKDFLFSLPEQRNLLLALSAKASLEH